MFKKSNDNATTSGDANPLTAEPSAPVSRRELQGFINEKHLLSLIPVSRRTLFEWRERGKIPCVRLPGSRRVLFHFPSVQAALLRLQTGGTK